VKRVLVSLVLAALAGCAGNAPRAEPAISAAPAATLESIVLPLAFFMAPARSAADDPRIAEVIEHGCGVIALVPTRTLPDDSPVFEIEDFYEIDAQGAVLRRWRGPTDVFVAGASGGLLGLQNGAEDAESFWLDGAGNLYRRRATDLDAVEWIDCPAAAPGAGTDFQKCVAVSDASTGARRTFVYQRPCT
jgi:hypothetical protein